MELEISNLVLLAGLCGLAVIILIAGIVLVAINMSRKK
jgi:hypothetical protein